MPVLEFRINGNPNELLKFEVKKIVNAGYTGRNQEEVQKHIDELKEKGIPAPDETPTYFAKFNDRIIQDETIEVLDETDHSGEAEYVLLCTETEIYVASGSDHTDRKLEEEDIPKAKQVYPNTISKDVWRLSEVKDYWDQIILRSWVEHEGQKVVFQEAPLAALLDPEDLMARVKKIVDLPSLTGMIIYSGTVAAKVDVDYSPYFVAELEDPKRNVKLISSYSLEPISKWFKK